MEAFNKMITTMPNIFMVRCKDINKGKKKGTEYIVKSHYSNEVRFLTPKQILAFEELSKRNPKEFISKLIDWHLQNDQILEFYQGSSYLLPNRYRRFYDKCVYVSTEKYELYFNDEAINKCSDIIYKLSERSKMDSYNFVKGKLESREALHMSLTLSDGFDFKKGRWAFYIDENDPVYLGPKRSVHYVADVVENGQIDEDDLTNILNLTEEFVKIYGKIGYVESNKEELVIHNKGSLKIEGIDKDKRIMNKVYQLIREEK
jgi:hypothetical protein